jgi:membrane associated rhomboid family serine protease
MRRPGLGRAASPTLDTLVAFVLVFGLQTLVGPVGLRDLFVAAPPPWHAPWTLVTSVYAHRSLEHLAANALGLALVGFLLERTTTRLRFHAFFLAAGVVATAAELLVGPVPVLGASGAVFALLGYLTAGNPVSHALVARLRLSARTQAFLLVGLAAAVTLVGAGPRVAIVSHFTGLLLGLVAGRVRLLRSR